MLNDKPKSLNLQLETDTHADEGASFTNQCWRCLCVRAVLSASAADVFLFVVDRGRVVFGFLGLIHFTTETGIWNAHNSLLWIGAELKKLTERGSSRRPEAHPPPKSLEPSPVVMATPPLLRLVISPPYPPSPAALTPGDGRQYFIFCLLLRVLRHPFNPFPAETQICDSNTPEQTQPVWKVVRTAFLWIYRQIWERLLFFSPIKPSTGPRWATSALNVTIVFFFHLYFI